MTHWTILLATEATEEIAQGGLFDLNATLPLMALQFLLLVAILNVVLYKPLGKALDERAQYIRNQLGQAQERKQKTEAIALQYEQELKDVRRKSQEIIATAQAEAEKIVSTEIQKAQQELQGKKEETAKMIAAEKAKALGSLEQQVDELSRQIIAKLLGPELVP
ncbi:F0F1 ATP synthase subunit B' [Gloeocapsa sp. PCC 73106]|uniref:F0F1 ATP synthase subunit B' n=1 Tax=Gloeocapsa sp. PCC 73106 TaxID=102232 RepID=UPI0002AC3EC5|nr:F0F1 ATP synthase subunit B' [Gloeocapsa sp. PCC 73106]ELR98744.1 F0F1-type ATP synthase, beta subunit [Gloeocapsa sp. PCC 73106]